MPYCIYLRKSRADAEAELAGEGETLARHEKTLLALAKKLKLPITKIYKEILSGETAPSCSSSFRMWKPASGRAFLLWRWSVSVVAILWIRALF